VHSNGILKLLFIGLVGLVLLIPMARITWLIAEREMRQQEAESEVRQIWGGPQEIGGPVLRVPYTRRVSVREDSPDPNAIAVPAGDGTEGVTTVLRTEYLHLLPEALHVEVQVVPEVRHRGLFEIVVYTARLELRGHFRGPAVDRWSIDPSALRWQETRLDLGLGELRGVREDPRLRWRGEAVELEPAADPNALLPRGIAAPRLATGPLADGGRVDFSLDLRVGGSGALRFLPLGRETRVTVTSPWPDPSFQGAFLPLSHRVGDDGFEAAWTVPYFARSYPQSWAGADAGAAMRGEVAASAFGVEFLRPVDFYQRVSRCTKYAVLFIGLTFGTFFLFELLAGLRIHPVQYLMVGAAMCVFYLLLLALAEHLGFGAAYLAAAVATVGLIGGYSAAVLRTKARTAGLTAALAGLYGVLYVLVQLRSYALLVGSVGLFAALAVAMVLTRRVDWYALGRSAAGSSTPGSAGGEVSQAV